MNSLETLNEKSKEQARDKNKHAVKFWNEFRMKVMRDYHDFMFKIRRSVIRRCIWTF